jgi:hypothetical protein
MELSRSFSLSEMTISQAAARAGWSNEPNALDQMNLKRLCNEVLQPIRDELGVSIHVSSGYRSAKVNRLIGGSETSAHCFGFAADITSPSFGSPSKLAHRIVEILRTNNIRFDQVILEFNQWVHVAVCNRLGLQRGQVLTAKSVNGQTVYSQGLS